MAGTLSAAAEARHVTHELAIGDLKLVEPLHLGTGVGHEVGPHDLGEVTIWLVSNLVSANRAEKSTEDASVAPSPFEPEPQAAAADASATEPTPTAGLVGLTRRDVGPI